MGKQATKKRQNLFIFQRLCLFLMCFGIVIGAELSIDRFLSGPNKAQAQCVTCDCVEGNHENTRDYITEAHGEGDYITDPESVAYETAHECDEGEYTRGWIAWQLCRHREEFIVFYFFKEHILAAMMMMTEQLATGALNQMFIIGTFLDAKMQLETQQLMQKKAAEAHKDYHPSFEMCEIGTLSRSLGASQRQGEFNAYTFSKHLQNRQMRNYSMSSAAGKGLDVANRWEHFRGFFCNRNANDQELGPRTPDPICIGSAVAQTANRDADVDYGRMVDYPLTIAMDLTDNFAFTNEQRIFGLASNLYGNNVFSYNPEALFRNPENQDEYMYIRSIVAKRSVAQNSFNNIVGMKSSGKVETEDLRLYMEKVLEQLGMSGTDPLLYLGIRPSYYAQMELLTKKLYQRPEFFTALYDKPVNVERKKAALQAIGLMQNMDLYKSKLRTEAALAVLTELELHKVQEELQNKMSAVRSTGR